MKTTDRQPPRTVPTFEFAGFTIPPSLRARVRRQLRHALVGVPTRPVHVRVSFTDVNGPKGGRDTRCAVDVTIPRTAPFHVEATAGDSITAFDQAETVVSRRIAQRLERRRDSGRHPKKYYAARRLL
jgi:hypothetical protein